MRWQDFEARRPPWLSRRTGGGLNVPVPSVVAADPGDLVAFGTGPGAGAC
jgi:hypothetical protein